MRTVFTVHRVSRPILTSGFRVFRKEPCLKYCSNKQPLFNTDFNCHSLAFVVSASVHNVTL
jgi:hypothetical protein